MQANRSPAVTVGFFVGDYRAMHLFLVAHGLPFLTGVIIGLFGRRLNGESKWVELGVTSVRQAGYC